MPKVCLPPTQLIGIIKRLYHKSGLLAQTQEECIVANTAVALSHQELADGHQHALKQDVANEKEKLELVKTGFY